MKKETKSFAEYKAPRCKCVDFHMKYAFMQNAGSLYGDFGAAANGYDSDNTTEYESDF